MRPWLRVPGDWRRPEIDKVYAFYWCDACQLGRQHPTPDEREIASFYDVDYQPFREVGGAPSDDEREASFADKLRVHLAWRRDQGIHDTPEWHKQLLGPPPKRICDVGCAVGELIRDLTALGYEVVGLEPVERVRQIALAKGYDVILGSAESLPEALENQRFDAVYMRQMLQLSPDPLLAVKNAASLLKEGGQLIVETANNKTIALQRAGINWRWLDSPRHLSFFTPESLRATCERAGLRVERTELSGYTRQYKSDWIRDEQIMHDAYQRKRNLVGQIPPRNSSLEAWKLLAETAFAPDDRKYDSVRIVASKPRARH